MFGGKKKKEVEKLEYINKLEPFKANITNYEDLKAQLIGLDFEDVKHNVDKQVRIFTEHRNIYTKYSQEIADKMTDEGYFLGMSEEQFNDLVRYRVMTGEEMTFRNQRNEVVLPFTNRKEELLQTKSKVTRSDFSRNKKKMKARDFIFENDVLVKIVNH